MSGDAATWRVTLLGCGTSTGVPVIGCRCAVCRSDHPRNRRLRTGAHLDLPGGSLLIDTPTDLRQQALRFRVERVDAVLFTHSHADHVMGLDELRIFNYRQRAAIPLYGAPHTLAAVRRAFSYVWEGEDSGGGKPRLELRPVDGPFELAGRRIVPVPVRHGDFDVTGWRLGPFAYVTDCNGIPESSHRLLEGVEVLVLDALRHRPHPTHFHLDEAIEAAREIGARRTIFTHMSHEIDYPETADALPPGMELGYDGLTLELA